MNFKLLIIAIIALPLSIMAQNRTNEFDNVLIKRGLTFKGGTPGANKVLTSDAAGNYTPQTLSAIDPNSLTNLANNVGISWTGQGTKVMTPVLDYAIILTNGAPLGPFAVTNAPNFFTSASLNTFNALTTFNANTTNNMTMITSNQIIRGGIAYIGRAEKTANYTNTINDYYIAWKGTTAGQVTNFLPSGVLNGRTYVIKDAQYSASTTNIVLKPLSTDTIERLPSLFINVNGQARTVTYDGVSNWEVN